MCFRPFCRIFNFPNHYFAAPLTIFALDPPFMWWLVVMFPSIRAMALFSFNLMGKIRIDPDLALVWYLAAWYAVGPENLKGWFVLRNSSFQCKHAKLNFLCWHDHHTHDVISAKVISGAPWVLSDPFSFTGALFDGTPWWHLRRSPGTPLDAPLRCPRPPPIVLGEVARWSIRLTLVDVIHKLINWLVISQWLINQFITNKLMKLRLFDQLLTLRGIYVLFLEQSTIFIMSPS